jgi:hypothetical protein
LAVVWHQEEEVHEDLAEDLDEALPEDLDEEPEERAQVEKLQDVHELLQTKEKAN